MRNGNAEIQDKVARAKEISSYPTYEEWKREIFAKLLFFIKCSYPTYEEWKQLMIMYISIILVEGSYPTYEEWKLYNDYHFLTSFLFVFLSYL